VSATIKSVIIVIAVIMVLEVPSLSYAQQSACFQRTDDLLDKIGNLNADIGEMIIATSGESQSILLKLAADSNGLHKNVLYFEYMKELSDLSRDPNRAKLILSDMAEYENDLIDSKIRFLNELSALDFQHETISRMNEMKSLNREFKSILNDCA